MPTTNAPSGTAFPDLLDLWFQAYIAALHRVEPISASMIADLAVRVALDRWGIVVKNRNLGYMLQNRAGRVKSVGMITLT